MSTLGSVTHWLHGLRAGQPDAVGKLFERFYERLARLARVKLRGLPKAAADNEGVANGAFHCFCQRLKAGDFAHLGDRDSLWRMLALITRRKAATLAQRENRLKRDSRRNISADQAEPALLSREPDPAFAAEMAETCADLFDLLPDDGLRHIARRKLEGWKNEEIAADLGISLATVERRLKLLRDFWENE